MCGDLETLDHLFFKCPVAAFVWLLVSEAVGWPAPPLSLLEVLALAKQGVVDSFEAGWVGAACVLWALWNIRNKLIFEGKILKNPTDAIFIICSFVQSWRPLWSDRLQVVMDWTVKKCRMKARRLSRRR